MIETKDLESALDELTREQAVRKKCYGHWVDEGRLTRSDARDRFTRLETAIKVLESQLALRDDRTTSSQEEGNPF